MSVDFMIIGAQKAATSSLQAALRSTPGVYMPKGESPFFEDPDYARRPWATFTDPSHEGRVSGIKRPDILCRPDLVERIALHSPKSKFIVVLREPISRAVSAYYHLARHAHIRAEGLNEGLRRGLQEYREGHAGPSASLIRFGLYGEFLRHWYQHFPSERFLIFAQPEITGAIGTAIVESCRHIGVAPPQSPVDVAPEQNVGMYDDRLIGIYAAGHRIKTRAIRGTSRRVPRDSQLMRWSGSALTRLAVAASDKERRPAQLERDVRDELRAIYARDADTLASEVPPRALYWSFDS